MNKGNRFTLGASHSTNEGADALTYAWDFDADEQYDDTLGHTRRVDYDEIVEIMSDVNSSDASGTCA